MLSQFTSAKDVPDPSLLLRKCFAIKENPHAESGLGRSKCLGLVFFNPSLRTRMSTQRAATNLGLSVICLNVGNDGWALELQDGTIMNEDKQEHIKDAVKVMSSYCDILGVRCFPGLKNKAQDYSEELLNQFMVYSKVPIVNLESATLHPLQSLADLMTINEVYQNKNKKPKIVLSWAPHPKILPQAVSNSFLQWMNLAGHEVVITHPRGYELAEEFTQGMNIEYNQEKALEEADFVYVKNWSQYRMYGKTSSGLEGWIINQNKMNLTNNGKLMHCLPVRRNVVVTDEVLDGPHSLIYQQAENRLYAAQAVLSGLLQ